MAFERGVNHVDVWYRQTEGLDHDALAAARALLSRDERARHDRFAFDRDRRDYAVAHALLRTALSGCDEQPPEAWTFEVLPDGKPIIASPTSRPLSFNLSHTHGFAACVVAPGLDVGVDVEAIDRNVDVDAVADRFFSALEIAGLAACAEAERAIRFFDLWTLKEAYIKAIGLGLSHPLDAMSFGLDEHGVVAFTPPPDVDGDMWQFALFAPTPRHRMAVAVHRQDRPCTITAHDETSPDGQLTPIRVSCD